MHRFFISEGNKKDNYINIYNKNDINHIQNVLRLGVEDVIELISEKRKYIVEIKEISNQKILSKVLKEDEKTNEAKININLYQSILKKNNIEWVIEKNTEIGVKSIIPIETSRTIVRLNEKDRLKRIERWNKISEAASKQSKRDEITKVKEIQSFNSMVKELENQKNILIAYELEKDISLKDVVTKLDVEEDINIIIGPEGGFTMEEIEKVLKIGAKAITLGPRVLRGETAGLVLSTILLYHFDCME